MAAIDIFALAVLGLGVCSLGLTIVYEASRLTASGGRLALARRRIKARQEEVRTLEIKVADTESRADVQQAVLDRLLLDRSRLTAQIGMAKASKVLMVHEVGEPDTYLSLYECDLRTVPDFKRLDARRLLFAREIWDRRNIAHIWAETPDAAMAVVQRAFQSRAGLLPGRLQPAGVGEAVVGDTGVGEAGLAAGKPVGEAA